MLAYLLLHRGTVVSADRLIGAMWGSGPPDTARAQVHAAVAAIRRVLRAAGAVDLLSSQGGGYVICAGPGQLDLAEFTGQMSAAQEQAHGGDADGAAERIRVALALWRGEPLSDVAAAYADEARTRLQGRRLAAVEQLAELELSLGWHDDLIDELAGEVAAYPLRERLCGQLMLALHRAGRQADALSAARAFRTALAERQGLDPSRAFAALEQAILRDDPHLDYHAAPDTGLGIGTAPGTSAAAAAEPGPPTGASPDLANTPQDGGAPQSQRPVNFLPYDTPDFSGRAAELDLLTGTGSETGAALWLIDGMAGVGKTALAVHAAHRLAGRYADAQLFVDLQANTGREPTPAGTALEILLRQLGVGPGRIPGSVTDRAALWRAETADRKVLAVLDNAADADHVRPLLPGASRSLILITSRTRLTGLDGAQVLSLDLLPTDDAVDLFTRIVGDRADAEPLALLDILQLCGCLPLAIRIAAARLQHRPQWTVAYLASRLRSQRHRLAELTAENRSVAAAFTLSYQHLLPAQQRMFRLLGLHPGQDIDVGAAAALADVTPERAEALLEGLLDSHLLAQAEPGRYTFHALLREHATATASTGEGAAARHDALTRLFDHYRQAAGSAIDVLYHYSRAYRPQLPAPESVPVVSFGTAAQATRWLDAERANVIAASSYAVGHDWLAHVSDLAALLRPYLDGHSYYSDALTLHSQALRASRQRGDRAGQGRALLDLGVTCERLGRYQAAMRHSLEALRIGQEIGDRAGEARAENSLGKMYLRQGDHDRARRHLLRALQLCRQIGNRAGEAHVLGNLGLTYEHQGEAARARQHHHAALDLHRELENHGGEADALANLGRAYQLQGEHQQARSHLGDALGRYRELGYRRGQVEAFNGLGEAARSMGEPAQALDEHNAALALACQIGSLPEQARAYDGLARAHRDLGHIVAAREHARQALDRYAGLGVPQTAGARAFLAELGDLDGPAGTARGRTAATRRGGRSGA
jgi:DNA-binding SARP family transcriptional activator/tetratricopeptide (TPR) repeat protein